MFATKDQGNRRAEAPGLTRNHHGAVARRLRRAAAGAVCAAAVALPLVGAAGAQAATSAPHTLASGWTSLALENGWFDYVGSSTAAPAVTNINGIVHLKGAIATGGTNQVAFTLPAGDRPATEVAVQVDLLGATAGQLDIAPDGQVTVYSEQSWNNAQQFTSLDGASFATSGSPFTPLTLVNGWSNYGGGFASASARNVSGIVRLRGAMVTGGTNDAPFTLPAALRPSHLVYVPVTLCDSNNGRLEINPNGVVYVDVEGGTWSHAQCGVSLDGAWFAKSASLYTPLTLQNGWTSYGFGTTSPAVRKINGIVHFEGAMSHGANPLAFTLPVGFRPSHDVYTSVDMDNANRGHILIEPNGQVTVFAEGSQSVASVFTSLDGVSFAP